MLNYWVQIFSSAIANEFSKNKQKNNQKEVQHTLSFMKLTSVLQTICMWVTPAYIVFAIPSGKGMLPFPPLNFLFLLIHAFDLMLHFNSKLLCCVLFCFPMASINWVYIEQRADLSSSVLVYTLYLVHIYILDFSELYSHNSKFAKITFTTLKHNQIKQELLF